MATQYVCDRCGTIINPGRDREYVHVVVTYTGGTGAAIPALAREKGTELCGDCTNSLHRWLKEAPPRPTPPARLSDHHVCSSCGAPCNNLTGLWVSGGKTYCPACHDADGRPMAQAR